ncbi:hypothetical protein CC78DRAFT_574096 [Lojkania enalia]|uniref:Uncharacterized protein n=1 Tax=Lojkania enalia TaxID=147567 RepID=A0A9P4NB73_9PLEO|nr:hypothetical protein CC78DRAFT_574096 [Didymosphaeria enalia]
MTNPAAFKLSPCQNPVNLSVEALVKERRAIKKVTKKIDDVIDDYNLDPSKPVSVEIECPEFRATQLLFPKDAPKINGGFELNKAVGILSLFSFVDELVTRNDGRTSMNDVQQAAETKAAEIKNAQALAISFAEPPPGAICTADITNTLDDNEKAFVNSDDNRRLYAAYRFDSPSGHDGGGSFNDAVQLQQAMIPVSWPCLLKFRMISWGGQNILRRVQVDYDQLQLAHGLHGAVADNMTIELSADEKINHIRMTKGE